MEGLMKIPPLLKVQPKTRGGAEQLRQSKRRVGRHRPAPVYDLVHALEWHTDAARQLDLSHPERLEEFHREHLAGMRRWSVFGDAEHEAIPNGSVVIHDLNAGRSGGGPREADAILVVDPNAALPPSITFERFEPVAGRRSQVCQRFSRVQLIQLPLRDGPQASWAATAGLLRIQIVVDVLRTFVREGLNHAVSVLAALRDP
jgi:hypothetical protein